jgi:hypothetical protein
VLIGGARYSIRKRGSITLDSTHESIDLLGFFGLVREEHEAGLNPPNSSIFYSLESFASPLNEL